MHSAAIMHVWIERVVVVGKTGNISPAWHAGSMSSVLQSVPARERTSSPLV